MATFPTLRSGKQAQYPSDLEWRAETEVLRFVDGSEQRFKTRKPQRRWTLRYWNLDEGELRMLEEFVISQNAGSGMFAFTDPDSGVTYAKCRLGAAPVVLKSDGWQRNAAEIVVMEVIE
jgi:hypothetical protein